MNEQNVGLIIAANEGGRGTVIPGPPVVRSNAIRGWDAPKKRLEVFCSGAVNEHGQPWTLINLWFDRPVSVGKGVAENANSNAEFALDVQTRLLEILFRKGLLTQEELATILNASY